MNPENGAIATSASSKRPFFRTRAFGIFSVWTLVVLASMGTFVLTRDIEDRADGLAAVYLGMRGFHEISLYQSGADPVSVTVRKGDEVVFVVRDQSYHNIAHERRERGDARIESGELQEGDSYSIAFPASGEYSFYDRLNLDTRITVYVK